MRALHGRAADGISLEEAVRHAVADHAVALLSTPGRYEIAQVRDGLCYGPQAPCPLEEVFEARLFSPELEVRWQHTAAGLGRAAALAERQDLLPAGFGQVLAPLEAVAVIPQRYLLWGKTIPSRHPGWASLYSARVGVLPVPLSVCEDGGRVRLTACEYVAVESVHGNAYVAEERLLSLEEDS